MGKGRWDITKLKRKIQWGQKDRPALPGDRGGGRAVPDYLVTPRRSRNRKVSEENTVPGFRYYIPTQLK